MIRRGLQILILVGITALGAAPSLAQDPPTPIFLRGWTLPGGESIDGEYHLVTVDNVASLDPSWSLPLPGYTGDSAWKIFWVDGDGWFVIGPGYGDLRLGGDLLNLWAPMTQGSDVRGGLLYVGQLPNETETLGMSSWAIVYGFGFAMAFWAAAVALSVSMKWVRDLASAAS